MLPIPTTSAYWAFAGCVVMLLVGITLRSLEATALAGSGFVGLAAAVAATMPLGRRVRRQRLEFAWWLDTGEPRSAGGAVVPGAPFEVRCYIRHRGAENLVVSDADPIVPGGARIVDEDPRVLLLAARARNEFTFRLVAPAAGRVVLHGLAVTLRGPLGLFEVPLYFPNPLAIKVLPRAAARLRGSTRVTSGLPVERSGRTLLRRRGGGTDLHELRELQPGDPFKSIAWKASARYGKLLVKEVEREVQETRWLVVDVSGTMRGGSPGARKLDFAIEAAAAAARRALDDGDRIGLVTIDGRIVSHVSPDDGAAQMLRIYEALLATTEVVDEDLTDVDEAEIVTIVARYVRQQDGIDFRRRDGSGRWDVAALVMHAHRALDKEDKAREVQAASPASVVLRRFCRARGIPLPYRPDPRDGSKGPGIAEALHLAGGTRRTPSSIIVITDFDGVGDPEGWLGAVKLVRAHRHALSFVVPDATTFAPEPTTALEQNLFRVYARNEHRRVQDARELLGRTGVPVLVATRSETPALVVARAERLRRAA